MTRRRLLTAGLVAACVFAGAWGIARIARSSSDALDGYELRWEFAAACVALMVCFAVIYAFCWALLLSALEGRKLSRPALVRLFLLTWAGRYVPASVAHYGGRWVAGPSVGAQRGAIAASFLYENLLTVAAAGAVSAALLLAQPRGFLDGGTWSVAAIGAAMVALTSLHPAVSRACIRIAARRVRRLAPLEKRVLPMGVLLRLLAGYALGAGFAGFAFFVILRGLGEGISPATAIAVYNLAGIAGMLAIAVPGGVGVREGVVVALLSGVVSPPVALAAALITRLAAIAADLTPLGFILLFDLFRRLTQSRIPTPGEAAAPLREAV